MALINFISWDFHGRITTATLKIFPTNWKSILL